MEEYYSIQQVADKAGVSQKTIRKLVSNGSLQAVRWGKAIRISETALINYLTEHETKRPAPAWRAAAKVNRPRVGGFKFL